MDGNNEIDLLELSKINVDNFKKNLVNRIDPAQISLTAKIPYKVLTVREALLYRATDLAESSCDLAETKNLVSAACTVRAFQETVAVLFFINRKVKKTLQINDINHLDDTVMRVLMGSRQMDNLPDPVNILTMIDKVNDEIVNFRNHYDYLSEITHPNWSGTIGLYSESNSEKVWTDFGRNIKEGENIHKRIVTVLYNGINLIIHIYNEFLDILPRLIKLCEEDIKQNNSP